jgi:hypothetical protein
MIYKIELLPRARKELLEAWNWYDDRWSGLGDRFMGRLKRNYSRSRKRLNGMQNAERVFARQQLRFSHILSYTGYKKGKKSSR